MERGKLYAFATVIIGGILTSTFLTLLVVPVLYDWIECFRKPRTSPS